MSPEERSLLEETYKIVKENNTLLTSMRRMGRVNLIMRITYWVVIIGASVGALYFIQPYLNFLSDLGSSGAGGINHSAQNSSDLLRELLGN